MTAAEIAAAAWRLKITEPENMNLCEQRLFYTLAEIYSLYRRKLLSYDVAETARGWAIETFEEERQQYETWLKAGALWHLMKASDDPRLQAWAKEMDEVFT